MNKPLSKFLSRRRMSHPRLVQQLWDALKVIKRHSPVATLEKIAKYMSNAHSVNEEEVSKQLQNCLRDNLIHVKKTKSTKGSKLDTEQEVYSLPQVDEPEAWSETHDWYCFTCHTSGDVILCVSCHRVYHCSCLQEGSASDKYVCDVCKRCEEDTSLDHVTHTKLNRVLSFICRHLKDKYPVFNSYKEFLRRSIYISSHGAQVDISTAKEGWRVPFLVYKPFDFKLMMALAMANRYKNVEEFIAHAQLIVHNVIIFHGDLSSIADTSRQMLRICLSEIKEMRACPTCYERLVLKQTRYWFCKPCKPAHDLVFAGPSYMPAKVLEEKDDKLLVVYFGAPHNRELVDQDSTLSIDTAVRHLVKDHQTWSKAMDELSRYQDMLEDDLPVSSDEDTNSKNTKIPDVIDTPKVVPKEKEKNSAKATPPAATKTAGSKAEKATVEKVEVKKKRGRPPGSPNKAVTPKTPVSSSKTDTYSSEDEKEEKEDSIKRRRGRPRKASLSTPSVLPEKKRKFRPRKKPTEVKEEEEETPEKEESKEMEVDPVEKELDENDAPIEVPPVEVKTEERRPESPTTTVSTGSAVKKNEEEIVSSSCMEPQVRCVSTQTTNNKKETVAKLKEELDEVRASHAEELKALKEAHALEIAAAKKKQWCYNCEQEAIYHCCWNTAYCSTECQQVHWQNEHKRVCRRKR